MAQSYVVERSASSASRPCGCSSRCSEVKVLVRLFTMERSLTVLSAGLLLIMVLVNTNLAPLLTPHRTPHRTPSEVPTGNELTKRLPPPPPPPPTPQPPPPPVQGTPPAAGQTCHIVTAECRQWILQHNMSQYNTSHNMSQYNTSHNMSQYNTSHNASHNDTSQLDTELPFPAGLSLREAYTQHVFNKWRSATNKSSVKFLGYVESVGSGLGNHVRSIYLALLLATITDRIFFVRAPRFHLLYDAPEGIQWRPDVLSKMFGVKLDSSAAVVHFHTAPVVCEILYSSLQRYLEQHRTVVHYSMAMVRAEDYLVLRYRHLLPQLRLPPALRFSQLTQWLLSSPSAQHRQTLLSASSSLPPVSDVDLVIGVRTFQDDGRVRGLYHRRRVEYFDRLTVVVERLLREEGRRTTNCTIYFSTDMAVLRVMAADRLRPFGRVVYYDQPVAHTGRERDAGRLTSAMVDFHYLSETRLAVITSSSFYRAARALAGLLPPRHTELLSLVRNFHLVSPLPHHLLQELDVPRVKKLCNVAHNVRPGRSPLVVCETITVCNDTTGLTLLD